MGDPQTIIVGVAAVVVVALQAVDKIVKPRRRAKRACACQPAVGVECMHGKVGGGA